MKYRLTVSGTVEFRPDGKDDSIKQLLLGKKSLEQEEIAIQELVEEAKDVKIEMVELK